MAETPDPSALALPDSPVGEQAAWFFRHSASLGRELTVEDVARHMAFPAPWLPANGLARFETADARPFRIDKLTVGSLYALELIVDYGDGKPWRAAFEVATEPPNQIVSMFWSRALPDDIVLRPAVAADSAALNDLEVRAPMTIGATTLVYDRGEDFLAFARLMEENVCFVAERDGALLGVACGASHRTRVGGQDYTVMLLHHLRVPVEHRKGGIFSAINANVFGAYTGRTDGAYGYTAVDNAEAMRLGGPGSWSIGPFRAVLDFAAVAGPAHGRTVMPTDADAVIDILNRGHEREEMYLPYTVESLAARLERAPDLYSWANLLVGDGAVVGVWSAGLRVTVGRDGEQVQSTRAVVLDHGFVPGAGAEFERLLRSWCGRLLQLGHTELTFLTSEPSPEFAIVSSLAAQLDPFVFRMAVPEPEGTSERGLYVDAIYF